MRIGEVSRRSGVSPRSLRYYEQLGLIASERESNGYRRYDQVAVERAIVIHMLFGMDFPREIVTSVLACTGDAPTEAHDALYAQLDRVRADLSERIETLVVTRSRIDEFLAERAAGAAA
ncbi:MerR family DNA-binding transcriptional regulator [Microbacterium sp. B19]|uniref:MerR family DNA-binding transcriptional regulator n=1 Tax=Microbacterium sp. B19 TaxID=96765 RepID=UPI00034BDB7C|nr:MerR family DNA-binding transcriptional regulator [Microbacterium sp. B19]